MSSLLNQFTTYSKRDRRACQEKNSQKASQSKKCPATAVVNNLYLFFSSFTLTERKVMNYLFSLMVQGRQIYLSQDRIAWYAGCSRQWVNGVLRRLEAAGVIVVQYRHMTSCRYWVSTYFWQPSVRRVLMPLFKAFYLSMCVYLTQYNIQGSKDSTDNYSYGIERSFYNYNLSPCMKEGQCMERNGLMGLNPVPAYIRGITEIVLTKWGQLRLVAYPEEAIAEARVRLTAAKEVRKPFAYFEQVCIEYCQWQGIEPNWALRNKLMRHFNAPEDPKLYYTKYDRGYHDALLHAKSQQPRRTSHEATKHKKKEWGTQSQRRPKRPYTPNAPQKPEPQPSQFYANHPHFGPPPQRQPIDRKKEYEKMEQYRKTDAWKWLESLVGKAFNPFADDTDASHTHE